MNMREGGWTASGFAICVSSLFTYLYLSASNQSSLEIELFLNCVNQCQIKKKKEV